MKHLLIAALLVSMGVIADDAAKVEEPAAASVEESGGHKDWPTLDEWWKANKLNEGTMNAEVLLGYEYSDLDDAAGNDAAQALLTRTRISYKTANMEGFDAFIQGQYVAPITDHYAPESAGYDVVADPENFRLHQVYMAYTGYDSHARIGSQEIILDNARLIGNVGWRLNAQSFNAGLVKNNSIEDLTLLYAYADSINDIFGNLNHNRQYHLLNAEYKLGEGNKVSAFAYLQRNDVGLDKLDTYGLRAWGKNKSISHDVMLASQRDAYYGNVFGEFDMDAVDVGLGVEYISGGNNANERFQTLNGTAHKFNGWADQFLGTGGGVEAGLIDFYGQVSGKIEKLKLMGACHWFNTADETAAGFDGDYGQEFDVLAKYPVCKNFSVLAKAAYYIKGDNHADNFTNDETVFWLRGTLTF
ncbi:MAG: hypothetical protein ABFR33_01065 [Verrucomicrobiota bacterium]